MDKDFANIGNLNETNDTLPNASGPVFCKILMIILSWVVCCKYVSNLILLKVDLLQKLVTLSVTEF